MDSQLFGYLNSFANWNKGVDLLILFCASYLPYIIGLGVLIWLWGRRSIIRSIIFDLAVIAVLARGVFTEIIRYFYDRPRPFEVLDVYQVIDHSAGGSLPSGHAAFFFAIAAAVFYHDRRLGIIFGGAAVLIGVARVMGGIHYPLDIIVGALVGILSAVLVYYGKRFWRAEEK